MTTLSSKLFKATPLALAAAVALPAATLPGTASAELSGNIGVHSKYLLRGIFEENDDTAVQGGLDYSHPSGFYAGWWASNLGYTYDAGTTGVDVTERGFENDIYGGYAWDMGGVSFDVGLIQYLYINVDDSNLTEATASVGFGPFSAGFQYLLNDGWWGNAGDIYWKLGYATDLPKGFGLSVDLGYYTYDDDDSADLCNPAPAGCGATTEDSGFRHLNFTLSHPVGDTGADMYVQYTVAGEDRGGNEYDDSMIVGLTYGFDI